MAVIKTDPSQTKTVITLLVVLAGLITFTVIRMRPGAPTPAPAEAAQQANASVSQAATVLPAVLSQRNPFEKPPFSTEESEMQENGFNKMPRPMEGSGNMPVPKPLEAGIKEWVRPLELDPDSLKAVPTTPPAPGTQPKPPEPADAPAFDLIATVKGSGGFSAVIRTEESNPRVVEVGDTVADGYRVVRLDEDCAVLSDGRNTIIAKRPRR